MTDGTYITFLMLHNRLKHLQQLKKYDIDTCSRPNSNCNNLLRQWELWKWHKSIKFYLIHGSPKFSITQEEVSSIRNTKLSDLKGAPNDGFLLNVLKSLFRLPIVLLRPLDMHSKRCCEICNCSFMLGEPEGFWNYEGFSVIFPKILGAIARFTKVRIFLIPLSIKILNPKILGFFFSYEN